MYSVAIDRTQSHSVAEQDDRMREAIRGVLSRTQWQSKMTGCSASQPGSIAP